MSVIARNVLIVGCHPSPESRCTRLLRHIEAELTAVGSAVIVDDLAALNFDPVLSHEGLQDYYRGAIPADMASLVRHLQWASDLVFVLPLWMFDMPAMLKGYFEKVFRPQVAFEFRENVLVPLLYNVRRMTVVVTHGRSAAETTATGDASREFFAKSLPSLLPRLETNARFDLYGLDAPDTGAHEKVVDDLRRHLAGGA